MPPSSRATAIASAHVCRDVVRDRSATSDRVSKDSTEGPLGMHIPGFRELLSEQGYASSTAHQKIQLIANFDQWLRRRRIELAVLDEQHATSFLSHQRTRNQSRRGDPATLRALVKYLRGAGAIAVPTPETEPSAPDRIAATFAEYLVNERGLRQTTVSHYLCEVRQFLSHRFEAKHPILGDLSAEDVTQFVLWRASVVSPRRAQASTGALRSFLRFLYQRGDIGMDLAGVVPTVRNQRFSGLPKFLKPDETKRLLQVCDLGTIAGRRDYAILLVLARLGLRAAEVVHMTLDDIDWDAGELVVRGKARREDRLPLPNDVGKALVRYLRYGRPRCSARRVFIRLSAPHQGFSSSVAICDVVRRALSRAGLNPAFKGSHLMRHSLATRMLHAGASMAEIGQILRHRLANTTEIYAKVDLMALRALAEPWPGGEA
jgi:integrase/recombinase XerD